MAAEEKNTFVKIAGIEIPIHLAWKKIEVLNTGADLLERLNKQYPHLASDFTHDIVPITRDRMKASVGDARPPKKISEDIEAYLKEKINEAYPADIVDMVGREKNLDITMEDLLYYVGEENYMKSMERQAHEYQANKISPQQTAELWNMEALPAPGKQHWTENDIRKLLGENVPI
jgi:hypothetical protein